MLISKYIFLAEVCLLVSFFKWDMLHLQFWQYQVESKQSGIINQQTFLLKGGVQRSEGSHININYTELKSV